ncbi:hypothetical protein N1851_033026 [Merluccius polli]|uniref:Uncharacterized protein n=1 Tax=Merluccius polli TaxID=89951 RepID=A0AA47NN76_MERPO|nr:hypothetical protein N1851_033026 [Merluccius polli]
MGTTTPVCHSTGTVPDIHVTLKTRVSQDSPRSPRSFLTATETSARSMDETSPKSSDSASSTEDVLEFLKVLFPLPDNIPGLGQQFSSPAEHSLSQTLLGCRTVCQNFLEADQKSFSIASSNSSHTRPAGTSAASGDPWASQARKASFFSLMASFTAGVHQWVLRLPPRQAPTTFRPQLLAAASAMEVLNMTHSDSMSPTSPGMCEKFFRRWELKTLRTTQFTLTTRLGLPGLSGSLPLPSDPTHHQTEWYRARLSSTGQTERYQARLSGMGQTERYQARLSSTGQTERWGRAPLAPNDQSPLLVTQPEQPGCTSALYFTLSSCPSVKYAHRPLTY